ncbi:hypothetical protein MRB53_031724 [Persea americana]|uniref:Uncharacterized protein n=1 Tax=Persea americana TaxID=3435 RepID=A0ACC2KQA3_PERAE|nr:hypothetical protein MRB53_031724 [Persea americana]
MEGQESDDTKQSTADMTAFVQNLLQQMQSRFQVMSESIVSKNILLLVVCDFLNCDALDDMGSRIEELEKSINDLKSEMGVEGAPSPLPPANANSDESKPADGSA